MTIKSSYACTKVQVIVRTDPLDKRGSSGFRNNYNVWLEIQGIYWIVG